MLCCNTFDSFPCFGAGLKKFFRKTNIFGIAICYIILSGMNWDKITRNGKLLANSIVLVITKPI